MLKNTIMLYIMQFSTYLLSFIVVPYETRVLGETYYGKLGVATAIMVYFQLVIDFGFILSATEEVSRHRENKTRISKILTSVTISKLFLTAGSVVVLAVLCQVFEPWQADRKFYMLFLIATAVNSLMPDYLYRGLEQMEAITVRTVAIKAFFTVMIVVLLKKPEQYCLIPILNIIGYSVALLCVYWHLYRRMHITFVKCTPGEVWASFRRSSTFFYSRIATSIYTASNTVILSLIPAGAGTVGYYSLADKLVTTAKSGLSPISDSMYPYMTKNKDFKLVWRILKIVMPVIIGGYGKERVIHSPAAGILRNAAKITDTVEKGQIIAYVETKNGKIPVYATLTGLLRGLIRDGYPVSEGFKIADIDPRLDEYNNCFTISDKARCIAGGVLEAVLHLRAAL